jgi:fumarylacetoacetase
LNDFISLGKGFWHEVRVTIQNLFAEGSAKINLESDALFKANEVKMTMPVHVGDYTDFYSSKNHAYNVGVMFRGPDNAL